MHGTNVEINKNGLWRILCKM